MKRACASRCPTRRLVAPAVYVIAISHEAAASVRREETDQGTVLEVLSDGGDAKALRQFLKSGVRVDPANWLESQVHALLWLRHDYLATSARLTAAVSAARPVSARKSARRRGNRREGSAQVGALGAGLPARTVQEAGSDAGRSLFISVVSGPPGHRSNPFVDAMNRRMQLAKRHARPPYRAELRPCSVFTAGKVNASASVAIPPRAGRDPGIEPHTHCDKDIALSLLS
jgi:hypothetical protein